MKDEYIWGGGGGCKKREMPRSRNGGSSPVNVRKAFLKEDLHIIQSFLPLRSESSVEQEACCHTVSPLVVMVASLSQCAKGWQPEIYYNWTKIGSYQQHTYKINVNTTHNSCSSYKER